MGTDEKALVTQSTDLNQLFSVKAFKAPPIPFASPVERRRSADRYLDESEIKMPLVVESPVKRWSGGTFAVTMERELRLDSGDGLEWAVNFPSDNLEPGSYRIIVSVNATEGRGQPLRSGSSQLRFEVRANDLDARPELLRRQAERHLYKEDLNAARQAAEELLKVHPNSALAHGIIGSVAAREGRREEATTRRAKEAEIRAADGDTLLLKYSRKGVILN